MKVSRTLVPVPRVPSTCLEALPVAVGSQGPQQEQEDQHCYAHRDGDIPHLHPLRVLLLPPLQIAELAPLSDVARHTAAKRTGAHFVTGGRGKAPVHHFSHLAY